MRHRLLVAAVATAVVLAWQAVSVRFNAEGNWSALYYSGEFGTSPAFLTSEDIYRFAGSAGYDGQFYHYLAHDPLLKRGSAPYLDNIRLRWRRIFLPGLAHVLSFGSDDYVDSAYFLLVALCVFAGCYWTSALAEAGGRSPWWGLAFLAVPAVAVSIDRMTVDVALAAACVGLVRYEHSRVAFLILTAAPFIRETGLLLTLAFCIVSVIENKLKRCIVGALTCLPYLVWAQYVHSHVAPDQTTWASYIPFLGLTTRTWNPVQYPTNTEWLRTAAALDYVALIGIWCALAIAFRHLPRTLTAIAATAFAGMAVMLSKPDVWADAYAFGRTLTPLLLFLAIDGLRRSRPLLAVPMLLVIPRIVFQFGPQWKGVLRGLRAAAF